jgi:small subunit ribosomal protein S20
MANIKSQIKRNRQTEVRQERNKARRSEMKTAIKRALEAAEAGDADRAAELAVAAQQSIDKAVSSGIIKKNTASRRKSQLHRQVNELLGA